MTLSRKGSRAERERVLRNEVRRLKASLSAIHDCLHADDVNAAHEQCECALAGGIVSQPNLSVQSAATTMDFAAHFNALAERFKLRACAIALVPSATRKGQVSLQICGEVEACKVVEGMLRGSTSVYMGDHLPSLEAVGG